MSDIQTIKDKIDIVELLGEYISLKKAGANWRACCPFHHEKTPSFMVQREKQIWHCFGCGKGGDIFSFVQEMEGLDFPEVLKILADRAGVKLTNYKPDVNKNQKTRILEINSAAANFFHQILFLPAAHTAHDYVFAKRALKPETVEDFKIGFIPDQWSLLTQYLLKKGFAIDDLIAAGLTIKKDQALAPTGPVNSQNLRGFYDRFRGRIMFPIWDVNDSVVGFTGRQLIEDKEAGGKYVNTPETLAFEKSRILYGLNKARLAIKAADLAIVVEGQMDVIACHQAGIKNVIASSGTALTEYQVKLISRYTNNVSFAFDGDAAGVEAAKRGVDLALRGGLNVRVIQIPKTCGKDADECLKKDKEVFVSAIKNAKDIMDWHFDRVLPKYKLSEPKQKQAAASELLAEIVKIPYAVERNEWMRKLSQALDVDFAVLKEESKKAAANPIVYQPQNAVIINKPTEPTATSKPKTLFDPKNQLFIKFWSLVSNDSSIYPNLASDLKSVVFENTEFFPIYQSFEKEYNDKREIDLNAVAQNFVLEKEEEGNQENPILVLQLLAEKDFENLNQTEKIKEAKNLLTRITQDYLKTTRENLNRELRLAENAGDAEKANQILLQINNLKI